MEVKLRLRLAAVSNARVGGMIKPTFPLTVSFT